MEFIILPFTISTNTTILLWINIQEQFQYFFVYLQNKTTLFMIQTILLVLFQTVVVIVEHTVSIHLLEIKNIV